MKIVDIASIDQIIETLHGGNLVAFPTETVYGLGADANNKEAVEKIFVAKGRPKDHPLIVHISNLEKLQYWGSDISPYVFKILTELWPGPLTVIVKASPQVKPFINGNQDSIAVRVPANLIALSILKEFEDSGGHGIVAPSANLFGQVSGTSAESVYLSLNSRLNDKHLIVNGGYCEIGIESTILDCRGQHPQILRPGPITEKQIFSFLDFPKKTSSLYKSSIRYSGMHLKHYAPKSKLVINENPIKGDGLIALDMFKTPEGVIRLAAPKNSKEYAYCLYESFRKADILNLNKVVAIAPEGDELEHAILDRLLRASYSEDNQE